MKTSQNSNDSKTLDFVTQELLDDSDYHPNLGGVTRGGICNHYSMTILAMQKLGANDEIIKKFKSLWPRSRTRIFDMELKDTNLLTKDNWYEYLGQAEFLIEFERVFLEGLQLTPDKKGYIASCLFKCAEALPMGLFHPLIRISFANLHGNEILISKALAYMAIRYVDLYQGPLKDPFQNISSKPEDVWTELSGNQFANSILQNLSGGSLRIAENLCMNSFLQDFSINKKFDINSENIEEKIKEICLCATRLYLLHPSLTTLHGVTAAQALFDLTLDNKDSDRELFCHLWRRYWIWLTGLYLEKGLAQDLPTIDESLDLKSFLWEDTTHAALSTYEVHVIKMVYSCQWLFQNIERSDFYKLAALQCLR